MKYISILSLLLFTSCSSHLREPKKKVVVSVSKQILTVYEDGKPSMRKQISTAKRGTGGRPSSYKTPLGKNLYVGVKKRGKYGLCVEIHGKSEDGYDQKGRYIEIHGSSRKHGRPGSLGCVTAKWEDALEIVQNLDVGDPVEIVR